MSDFPHKIKYQMEEKYSIDIDSQISWIIAEELIKNRII
jgi:CMP-N-acetylneuraminic acid synthetase